MYEKILKKLQALSEIYDFDIYEFMDLWMKILLLNLVT